MRSTKNIYWIRYVSSLGCYLFIRVSNSSWYPSWRWANVLIISLPLSTNNWSTRLFIWSLFRHPTSERNKATRRNLICEIKRKSFYWKSLQQWKEKTVGIKFVIRKKTWSALEAHARPKWQETRHQFFLSWCGTDDRESNVEFVQGSSQCIVSNNILILGIKY